MAVAVGGAVFLLLVADGEVVERGHGQAAFHFLGAAQLVHRCIAHHGLHGLPGRHEDALGVLLALELFDHVLRLLLLGTFIFIAGAADGEDQQGVESARLIRPPRERKPHPLDRDHEPPVRLRRRERRAVPRARSEHGLEALQVFGGLSVLFLGCCAAEGLPLLRGGELLGRPSLTVAGKGARTDADELFAQPQVALLGCEVERRVPVLELGQERLLEGIRVVNGGAVVRQVEERVGGGGLLLLLPLEEEAQHGLGELGVAAEFCRRVLGHVLPGVLFH